ncbi:hypothetical protein ACMFMG_000468 [Clarireedia jacksonii]
MEETITLPPDDYTVGWICAIETELKVARAMLDKTHSAIIERDPNDDNIYTLGSVGQHNVVIACLPEYGIATAATAAKDLMRTFRNVKFGLMVGIGGGIPSAEHDIRLGDVVVSMPTDTDGGVIQYDLGRYEKEGFRRKGSLNKPPRLLRSAAIQINTTATTPKDIAQLITQAWERIGADLEDDENEWMYPGVKRDVLFKQSFDHIGHNPTCAECAQQGLMLQRSLRKSTYPKIHRGNIASGNTVMKNAMERDALAKAENVICFEMEAAGLMDSFPCLVIRGVSDYADTHKNGDWQPYAAAVAAAYAKLLLSVVPPAHVKKLEPIQLKNKHWVVPSTKKVSIHFTGRKKILERLGESLCPATSKGIERGGTFVIQGMGGAGKSQICVKFADENRERFWGVFWVDGTTEETIKRSFVDIGTSWQKESSTPETVMRWLANEQQPWLLILDNCDDINLDYNPYVLSGHRGSIIMTTRNPECRHFGDAGREVINSIEIEDAVTLLCRACELDEKSWPQLKPAAQKIAEQLHCHPLALTQAGAYISQKRCSIDSYLRLFESEKKELCKNHIKQGKSDYGGVYATFEVSATAMSKSPEKACHYALELLNILAYLYREDVTEEMFLRVWNQSSRNLQEDDADDILAFSTWHYGQLPKFIISRQQEMKLQKNENLPDLQLSYLREARNTLQSFSLVSVSETCSISMHPLAHAWAKDRLQIHCQNRAWVSASTVIAMSIEGIAMMQEYFRNINMHINFCFGNKPKDLLDNAAFQICIMLYRFWWVPYRLRDNHGGAKILATLQGQINLEAKIRKPSMNWSYIQYLSALEKYDLKKLQEAKEILEEIMEFYQVSRPWKNHHLAAVRESLTFTYVNLGNIGVAKGLLKRLVRISPTDSRPQYELAGIYYRAHEYHKAKKVFKKALKLESESESESFSSLRELAKVYLGLGDYRKVLLIGKDVYYRTKKLFHEKHTETLDQMHILAITYRNLGQYKQAIMIAKHVVRVRREILDAKGLLSAECLLSKCIDEQDETENWETDNEDDTASVATENECNIDVQASKNVESLNIGNHIASELVQATYQPSYSVHTSEPGDDVNLVGTSTRALSKIPKSKSCFSLVSPDDGSDGESYVLSEGEAYELSDAESCAISVAETCEISDAESYSISSESSLEFSDGEDPEVQELLARLPLLDPEYDETRSHLTSNERSQRPSHSGDHHHSALNEQIPSVNADVDMSEMDIPPSKVKERRRRKLFRGKRCKVQ